MALQREQVLFDDTGSGNSAAKKSTNNATKNSQIERQISECKQKMESIYNLKGQLEKCINALNSTKSSFANGGHCYGGNPLGASETESCISNLKSAIDVANKSYEAYNATLSQLYSQYNTPYSVYFNEF